MITIILLMFIGTGIDASIGVKFSLVDKFNHLTKEEFIRKLSDHNAFDGNCDEVTDDDIVTNNAPDEFDWTSSGTVTAVKNQGKCVAGWAFALIGNIEGQYAIKHGEKIQFSEQELIDCLDGCDGCEHCSSSTAMSSLIDLGGVQRESDYPYANTDSKQDCEYKPPLSKVKIKKCTNYNLVDENKLKEVLFNNGPLHIAVNGNPLRNYKNGILRDCPGGEYPNHSVLLIGYGSENNVPYWLIKNSWGTHWGEQGFARIRRCVNACGLMNPETASVTIK